MALIDHPIPEITHRVPRLQPLCRAAHRAARPGHSAADEALRPGHARWRHGRSHPRPNRVIVQPSPRCAARRPSVPSRGGMQPPRRRGRDRAGSVFARVVSSDGRNTSDILGGRVDIDATCEEGAGAAATVGQAPAVHGAAGARVEHPGAGSGGRRVAERWQQLGSRVQDLPQRGSRRVRASTGPAHGSGSERPVLVRGRADRDRRPAPCRAEHPSGRPPAGSGTLDDLPVSCTATPPAAVAIDRSRRSAGPPLVVRGITGAASRPTRSCGSSWPSCRRSAGARSRSAVT